MAHDNEGAARLVRSIRNQASKVFNTSNRTNMLGTIQSNGVYVDAIEDLIPKSEFLFLQTGETLQSGDRVLCVPVGDYYAVLGKVT